MHTSLAQRLWGIDWQKHFPVAVGREGEIAAQIVPGPDFLAFVAAHYATIYDNMNRGLLQSRQHASRQHFYLQEADLFGFYHGAKLVGVIAANAVDWSTYYLRSSGILPEYQGRGLFRGFVDQLFGILAEYGVERVEGEVDPANIKHVGLMTRMGFFTTGYTASERWGNLVKLTKFLNTECDGTFRRQFCSIYDHTQSHQNGSGAVIHHQ